MPSVVAVSPFRCRMWSLHDRLDSNVTEETCRDEIESFARHGQLVPVLGRSLHNEHGYDVELIYGARRLFVARHINKPLLVEIREINDRDAIVAMDIENRQRTDISPYERGLSYARWLRAGFFKSQDDIARALKISSSQVSRLLKLARLPSILVESFGSPVEICEGWGLDLAEVIEDPDKRAAVVRKARSIVTGQPRPPAREVYRQLLAASAGGCKPKPSAHDEIVKDAFGTPLFRIRQQTRSVAIIIPVSRVSARKLVGLRNAIVGELQDTTTDAPAPEPKPAVHLHPAVKDTHHAQPFVTPANRAESASGSQSGRQLKGAVPR